MLRFTYTALAAAAALHVSSASPVGVTAPELPTSSTKSVGFTVRQVAGGEYTKYGPLAVAKTYNKFGIPLPANIAAAVNSSRIEQLKKRGQAWGGSEGSGTVTNSPLENDLAYVTEVQLGTPPQTIPLDFDSGSSDLWVAGRLVAIAGGQKGYSPSSSNTSALTSNTWSISYGDGSSAGGSVYKDTVTVGGVSVEEQAIELALMESSAFLQQKDYSGLLGLAFSQINQVTPTKQKTFFDNVKDNLDLPVFTADLKRGAPGSYDFGYIDQDKYTGNVSYTPVDTSKGFWSFTSPRYAVGSGSPKTLALNGIADTGTTLLYLPTAVCNAYYAKVQGSSNSASQGGYIFPCTATLPSLSFGIDGDDGTSQMITIPGTYLNYATNGDGTCFGGMQDDSGLGFSIFGDVALKAAFVVFDGSEPPRLGWANKST